MIDTAPELRLVVSKVRGQPTFVNVYLPTGEFVGTKEMDTRQALHFSRQLLEAASLDLGA